MKKELRCGRFRDPDEVPKFVERNKISKKDIQEITSSNCGHYIFYWGNALVSGAEKNG